ncbi:vWA domain-containing protein [Methylophaga muralis]|uniref:von Willebrand factor type A domain protein n=1 Tax=Methylophaga muralis TaxID=291169 RepID=A0A1E3GQN6_9GAMM|nr:vWA domain-containing protein [Methylophaga muralis]ODN66363.1 von Willebrand factor type A domain protein [Methylophaga muralis]
MSWSNPYLLYLLPLAVLPWLSRNNEKQIVWQALLPKDSASVVIGFTLYLLASVTLASLIMALAGPHIPEHTVQRSGQGAEVIILLDRSRSMDQPFARRHRFRLSTEMNFKESKRSVARYYLTEFVNSRPDDRFAYLLFSEQATTILPLTYSKETTLATIEAGGLGRGLTKTDIAVALKQAGKMFDGETYRGARIVLLISDGGQILSTEQEQQISQLLRENQLTLYWIYMRSVTGMTLDEKPGESILWQGAPERQLHNFFKTLDVPYRAFEAGSLEEFSEAMATIDQQHYQTLMLEQRMPRQSLADYFLWVALLSLLPLTVSQLYTWSGVSRAYHPKKH